jgi:hypothetical protein
MELRMCVLKRQTIVALALLVVGGGARAASAQTAQAAKLSGLPAAMHAVVTVDSLARAAGIDQDALGTQIESTLLEEGFETMTVFGGSSLLIEIHAFQVSTTPMLVYDVGLEYHTFAVPARQLSDIVRGLPQNAQIPVSDLTPLIRKSVDVALYRRAVYGVGPRTRAEGIVNVVMRNLDVFLTDFRAANRAR